MVTCKEAYNAQIEVKHSKFIAHLAPYSEFSDLLTHLQKRHPKARHFVTAFRYYNEHGQIVEGSSDDGEPKGTSGKPSLHVLQGADLVDVGVVIVRYFGGIKLGTGGLVRAYSDAVNRVIEEATTVAYERKELFCFTTEYSQLSKVEYVLQKLAIHSVKKDFEALHVALEISAASERIARLKSELARLISY